MVRLWTEHDEPAIAEVLDDPIIQMRMASAGLTREEMSRSFERAKLALLAAKARRLEEGEATIRH